MREMSGDKIAAELRRLGVTVVNSDNDGITVTWQDAENLLRILLADEERFKEELAKE